MSDCCGWTNGHSPECRLESELTALKAAHQDCVSREEYEEALNPRGAGIECHDCDFVINSNDLCREGICKECCAFRDELLSTERKELSTLRAELADSNKAVATYSKAYHDEKDLRSDVKAERDALKTAHAQEVEGLRKELAESGRVMAGANYALGRRIEGSDKELAEWQQAFPTHERREGCATPKEAALWVDNVCKEKNRLFDDSIRLKQALAEKEQSLDSIRESLKPLCLNQETLDGCVSAVVARLQVAEGELKKYQDKYGTIEP